MLNKAIISKDLFDKNINKLTFPFIRHIDVVNLFQFKDESAKSG